MKIKLLLTAIPEFYFLFYNMLNLQSGLVINSSDLVENTFRINLQWHKNCRPNKCFYDKLNCNDENALTS